MAHLEVGRCTSRIDFRDIDTFAYDFYGAWAYANTQQPPRPYCCPTCRKTFTSLSRLLRHVESNGCTEQIGYGILHEMLEYVQGRMVARTAGLGSRRESPALIVE